VQVWECTEIGAAWLNLMREAINGQVFAHGNPGFLAVAAVHGSAHLALFDHAAWQAYGLGRLAGGAASQNPFLEAKPGTAPSDDIQDLAGYYGPANNNIWTLQRRGAVFVACHDSIHAIARGLRERAEAGPSADAIAADLTNHLVPGAVLVPSVVAFLVELQRRGFTYAKGG
jgi:intracellular sulfur oxidation DsrE/DsrF family protein